MIIFNKMRRVYPVRTTRDRWKIPLFCQHKCNENCNILFLNEDEDDYVVIENPNYKNGKCPKNNILEKTFISISNFNIDEPSGHFGPLYNSDVKVISDNSFKLLIYYPLSYVFEVIIQTPTLNGFTLKELIYSIKNLYEYIYSEEERTAIPQIYQLKKLCTTCGNQNLTKYINECNKDKINEILQENCCICYSNYEDINDESKPVNLKCNHIFHNNCIKEWLKKSGTCPICRTNIFECNNCDGSGIIYYNFTGVVIPLEERGNILNRNQTYGIFGIHSHDLEDLIIQNLFYDNVKKQLYVDITT